MNLLSHLGVIANRSAAAIKAVVVTIAICFCAPASAGSVTGATITGFYLGTSYGSMVFISVSVPKTGTGNPSCSTNTTWSFVMPLATALENQMLAVLLSARATGVAVTLTGSGACDVFSSVETLENITY